MPAGAEEGILRGMYKLRSGSTERTAGPAARAGTILNEVVAAAELLVRTEV